MESKRYVRPLSPVVAYIGGKRKLAPAILPWIEAVEHRCYAEPFVGMGGLFLQRRFRPPVEAINDRSADVATFFRILQRHYTAFVDLLRYQITSRTEFDRLVRTDPSTLTDMERASRFLYLQACTYGGKAAGRTFGIDMTSFHGFDPARLKPLLEAVHGRLSGVVIESLGFADFIARYDGDDTLFYIDPPYCDCEGYYGRDLFRREDFSALAEQLRGLRGRFVLSINEHPAIRAIFSSFHIESVPFRYSLALGEQKDVTELIVVGPPQRQWSKEQAQGALL